MFGIVTALYTSKHEPVTNSINLGKIQEKKFKILDSKSFSSNR